MRILVPLLTVSVALLAIACTGVDELLDAGNQDHNACERGDNLIENCAFELLLLALVPIALVTKIRFEVIVAYHFIFWVFFPLWKFSRSDKTVQARRYIVLTIWLTLAFIVIAVLGSRYSDAVIDHYMTVFIALSYLHITLAFATSTAHPDWLIHWFRPSPTAAQRA